MENLVTVKNENVNFICFALLSKIQVESTGIAHLMEHMAFRKAGDYTQEDIYHISENLGVNINATTYKDYIRFDFICRKEVFIQIIDLMAKMFYEVDYDEIMFDAEKKVVCAEIRQRYYSNAERIIESLWENEKYGQSILGTEDTIKKIELTELINFKKNFLIKSPTTIFLMGNYDEEHVKSVEQLFVKSLSNKQITEVYTSNKKSNEKVNLINTKSDTYFLYYAFHLGCDNENKLYKYLMIKIIDEILFSGNTAYLKTKMREKEGLIYEFESYYEVLGNEIVYMFGFELEPYYTVETIRVFIDEIKNITLEDKYLNYIKAFYCDNFEINYQSFINTFYDYINNYIVLERVVSPKELSDKIAVLTKNEVEEFLKELLQNKKVFLGGKISKKTKKRNFAKLYS